MNEPGGDLVLAQKRDRDRKDGEAMQEIGCPVERIDDPGVTLVGPADLAAFFEDKAIAGPCLAQSVNEDFLGPAVGRRDEIARPLDRDLEIFQFAEVAL